MKMRHFLASLLTVMAAATAMSLRPVCAAEQAYSNSLTADNTYLLTEVKNDSGDMRQVSLLPSEPLQESVTDLQAMIKAGKSSNLYAGLADRRYRVESSQLNAYPYSAVCKLRLYFYDQNAAKERIFTATGFVISKNAILTCAHCLYNPADGLGWAQRVLIDTQSLSGNVLHYDSQTEEMNLIVEPDYYSRPSDSSDCGLIMLSSPIGALTGTIGLSTDQSEGEELQTAGYPVDRNKELSSMNGTLQSVSGRKVKTSLYAGEGQSGSPYLNSSNQAIGILSFGSKSKTGQLLSTGGPVIDEQRLKWISENAGLVSLDLEQGLVYRIYNPNSGEHLFTENHNEIRTLVNAGWKFEGAAWPSSGDRTVYRLYNPNTGDHHYTADLNEYRLLGTKGWRQEDAVWSVDPGTVTIYRVYNPNAKTGIHHFTTSQSEAKALVSKGWMDEGMLK